MVFDSWCGRCLIKFVPVYSLRYFNNHSYILPIRSLDSFLLCIVLLRFLDLGETPTSKHIQQTVFLYSPKTSYVDGFAFGF